MAPLQRFSVAYGGRVLPLERSLKDAGVQQGAVLSITGRLAGGTANTLAMRIAYKRDKEQKRKAAKDSKFVTLISGVRCARARR